MNWRDPRSEINRKHPLASVVVIAPDRGAGRGVGADGDRPVGGDQGGTPGVGPAAAARVPCKDVFRRVLMALRPETFQACFAAWVRSLRDEAAAETGVERPTLAIDGKTLRRSHDRKNGLGALHSVTVCGDRRANGSHPGGDDRRGIGTHPVDFRILRVSRQDTTGRGGQGCSRWTITHGSEGPIATA